MFASTWSRGDAAFTAYIVMHTPANVFVSPMIPSLGGDEGGALCRARPRLSRDRRDADDVACILRLS